MDSIFIIRSSLPSLDFVHTAFLMTNRNQQWPSSATTQFIPNFMAQVEQVLGESRLYFQGVLRF